jgi:hypothetical protein
MQIAAPTLGASINKPNEWASYEAASAFVAANPTYGLGFVLTKECGLTCVDLDATEDATILARHSQIFNELFPMAYAELSPSGKGCHLWMFGNAPTKKASSLKLEVYSAERYMTVTLNPIRNVELTNMQPQLAELISAIERLVPRKDKGSADDAAIVEKCKSKKFDALHAGNWQGLYPSQSEADSALVYMITQWTNDPRQIARLFLASGLGQRDKAKRPDYVTNIVSDALRDKTPTLDKDTINSLDIEWMKQQAIKKQQEQVVPDFEQPWPMPPGLIGEIANFIYNNAIYPNIEVALAGAIAFMSGVCGRAFNTCTGTGLNQYIVLIGGTSQGKEASARGISVLSDTIVQSYRAFELFMGPGDIASAQGLLRRFEDSTSFVARIGEFGHWMQKINSRNASLNDVNLRKMLLDIFTKSGTGDILPGSVYAERAKNVPNIKAPALTILGDTTPEEFYKSITDSNVAEGLVSRLSIITIPKIKPWYNENGNKVQPPKELIEKICKIGKLCVERMASDQSVIVPETEDARQWQLNYQKKIADLVWEHEDDPTIQIWHRAHLRLLRTGALLAVCENPDRPQVEVRHYEWARLFIDRGCQAVIGKYNRGEVGINTTQYELRQDVEKCLLQFCKLDNITRNHNTWQCNERMIANNVINKRVIQLRISAKRSYREDHNPSITLSNIMRDLESEGIITALPEKNDVKPTNGANYYTPTGKDSKAKYWHIDRNTLK